MENEPYVDRWDGCEFLARRGDIATLNRALRRLMSTKTCQFPDLISYSGAVQVVENAQRAAYVILDRHVGKNQWRLGISFRTTLLLIELLKKSITESLPGSDKERDLMYRLEQAMRKSIGIT